MTREEQPKFKQEFYGEWVTNPKYEIYSATQFYRMLRYKSNEKPIMGMSQYKELGGWWLVELTDNIITDYWRFDFRHQANYWKREKEQTNGK